MDVEAIRKAFPILHERVPGRDGETHTLRLFDNAASTHAPEPVVRALVAVVPTS